MTRKAVDTWAFIEAMFQSPRSQDVDRTLKEADGLITSREIVIETCNFIVGTTRRTAPASEWLRTFRSGRIRIVENSMREIEDFMATFPAEASLSYADASLALAATKTGVNEIVTEDQGFRALRLFPTFAKAASRE